jgi:hypothetical protein
MSVDIVSVTTQDGIKLHSSLRKSAGTYYAKYGLEEQVNILTHLPNVKLPLLAYHGTEEPAAELPMRGVLEELTRLTCELPNFSHTIVPNGDHFVTGQRPYVGGVMRDWLMSLS